MPIVFEEGMVYSLDRDVVTRCLVPCLMTCATHILSSCKTPHEFALSGFAAESLMSVTC